MLSVKEFAELFGVSKRTVFRWIEKGEVNAVKICGTVRIPEDEVQRKSGVSKCQKTKDFTG